MRPVNGREASRRQIKQDRRLRDHGIYQRHTGQDEVCGNEFDHGGLKGGADGGGTGRWVCRRDHNDGWRRLSRMRDTLGPGAMPQCHIV